MRHFSPNCLSIRTPSAVRASSTVCRTDTHCRSVRILPSAAASSDGAGDFRSAPHPAMRKSIASLMPSAPRMAISDLKHS